MFDIVNFDSFDHWAIAFKIQTLHVPHLSCNPPPLKNLDFYEPPEEFQ